MKEVVSMNKKYISPDLEIVKFTLTADVLGISQGEIITSSGVIEEPDDDMSEEL